MNSIVIFGRITKDIDLKQTTANIPYTRFNVASKSMVKDENGEYKTNFFTCLAWREKATRLQRFVKKGDQIVIKGSLNSRSYEKNGETIPVWEVNVEDFAFVSGNKTETLPEGLTPAEDIDADDLPF